MSSDSKDVSIPSANPVEDISKGVAKAAFEIGEEKLKAFVDSFLHGELAFIEDKETIEIVRNQRKKPEWLLYRQYIKDPDLRLQIEMGFSLRQMENDKEKLTKFKSKIYWKYKSKGLHVAELVQRGIFGRYIGLLLENSADEKEIEERIESILNDIEKYVVFVQATDNPKYLSTTIAGRINTLLPKAMIIFSRGVDAKSTTNIALKDVKKHIKGYKFEFQTDDSGQQYDFLLKES